MKTYYLKYYQEHKEERKKYYQEHREKLLQRMHKYYVDNAEVLNYKYYHLHQKENQLRGKEYYQTHKEQRKEYCRKMQRTNVQYRLKGNLTRRITKVLRGTTKLRHTFELIGCSPKELKQHLQKQFQSGMTWKNYGKWHVDHIRPCASFDLQKFIEQKKCFHYTNLQPLWAKENISKGCKIGEK